MPNLKSDDESKTTLPLPEPRCLNREHAAAYLGIGVTLFMEIAPPPIRFGRRKVYDRLDLDKLLDEYKRQGRAKKEAIWPEKEDSSGARTRRTGGWTSRSKTDAEYKKVLGIET